MAKTNSLNENIEHQISWVEKKINNVESLMDKDPIFYNFNSAVRCFNKLTEETPFIGEQDFIHFRDTYITKSGIRKLRTTLRVYKARQKDGYDLQVSVSKKARGRLEKVCVEAGNISKNELVDTLLSNLDIDTFNEIKKTYRYTVTVCL
ncbi:hypothetical protein [Psychromonas sp. KJ10-2]|uniref:hypothetical protein n=1 Tax=Psychromonas sp. KJ10-2 TaxID=3391822 RepID=UPI0039B5E2E1